MFCKDLGTNFLDWNVGILVRKVEELVGGFELYFMFGGNVDICKGLWWGDMKFDCAARSGLARSIDV